MARILVVDDEQDLVWGLRHSLQDEGYEVDTAYDGLEGLEVARRHRPDLVILDIAMPRLDGLEVCRRLRRDPALAAVPILFLTVRGGTEDRVKGLDEGSDDYLLKPFALAELKARVRALLRRSRGPAPASETTEGSETLVVGALALDLRSRQVRVGKTTAQLTCTEFDLLRHLMAHPGEIHTSARLLQQVWNYPPGAGDPGLVRWHMKNLRAKIEADPAHPRHIRTVSQQGYILAHDA